MRLKVISHRIIDIPKDLESKLSPIDIRNLIQLVDRSTLLQTEECVTPEKLDEIIETIKHTNSLSIILLTASNLPNTSIPVTLDGNHRFLALQKKNYPIAPIVKIKWDDFDIEGWDKGLIIHDKKMFSDILDHFELALIDSPDKYQDKAIIRYNNLNYIFKNTSTKLHEHQEAYLLMQFLSKKGITLEGSAFKPKELATFSKRVDSLTIKMPSFSKKELERLLSGSKPVIMPPKSFKTKLPNGPIALPIDTNDLNRQQLTYQYSLELYPEWKSTEGLCQHLNFMLQDDLHHLNFFKLPHEIDISPSPEYRTPVGIIPVPKYQDFRFNLVNISEISRIFNKVLALLR